MLPRIGTRAGGGKFHAKNQTDPVDDHQLRNPELRSPGGLVPACARWRIGTAASRVPDTHADHPDIHADNAVTDTHTHNPITDTHSHNPVTHPNTCHPVTDTHPHDSISHRNTAAGIAHAAIHQHTDLTLTRPATANTSATQPGLSICGGGIRDRRHWRADQRRHSGH